MIVLASQSPRRRELLSLICEDFTVEPADIDESITDCADIEKIPEHLALKKAEYISGRGYFNDIVIGCDTGVFLKNEMLGKPKNEADARRMLNALSGKKHKVITGCALVYKDRRICFSQCTKVEFYKLSQDEISAYINTGEPMDKAGAYGIQGKGGLLVKQIQGDYFSVVGLPIAELYRCLKEIKNT